MPLNHCLLHEMKSTKKKSISTFFGAYLLVYFYCVYGFPVNSLLIDIISVINCIIILNVFFWTAESKNFKVELVGIQVLKKILHSLSIYQFYRLITNIKIA